MPNEVTAAGAGENDPLSLRSPAFANHAPLPRKYMDNAVTRHLRNRLPEQHQQAGRRSTGRRMESFFAPLRTL
jgi:hypothetical protein